MAVKVSDLTTESAPASTDILLIADPTTGVAKKITVSALKTYMDGLGGGSDVTAPTIVSIVATTASTIVVTFSESVTVTTAGWSFTKNASAWTISSVTGSGASWTFTMGSSGLSTDTILYSYDSATGSTVDTSSNELATVSGASVTNSIPGVSFDADAQAFFDVNTGLTAGQKSAVNDLVVALKAIGWSKFLAIYPYVGGTASAHKWNLKDPRDLDAAFRLTFSGSFTHASTGVTPAGTSTYQNTYINPNLDFTDGSVHLAVYLRTNTASTTAGYEWGIIDGGSANFYFNPRRIDDTYQSFYFHGVDSNFSGASTDSRGLWCQSLLSGESTLYKNGSSVATDNTLSANTEATSDLHLSNYNYSPGEGSTREMAFACIGTGLNSTEAAALYTAVQAYQTALSRNV